MQSVNTEIGFVIGIIVNYIVTHQIFKKNDGLITVAVLHVVPSEHNNR